MQDSGVSPFLPGQPGVEETPPASSPSKGLPRLLVSMATLSLHSRLQVLPEGSLRIQPVLAQDAGHYLCLASNSAGSDRQGRDLQVFGRWTREGMLLAFSVHPRSGLGPAWFLGSSLLSGAKSHSLSSLLTMKPMSKTCKQADSKDACLFYVSSTYTLNSLLCTECARIENICKERIQNHCTRASHLLFSLQWIPLVGAALLGTGLRQG